MKEISTFEDLWWRVNSCMESHYDKPGHAFDFELYHDDEHSDFGSLHDEMHEVGVRACMTDTIGSHVKIRRRKLKAAADTEVVKVVHVKTAK